MNKAELIDKIVEYEWDAFHNAPNEGGRAFCQNDPETFGIMRRSQYLTWPEPLLEAWLTDLQAASAQGWNVMTEKYARMEQSLDPQRYARIEHMLPPRSDRRRAVAEQIVQIQVGWMEEFAAAYPKMAGRARYIHTEQDSWMGTSYETYLRAELGTYSDETLMLYGRFIIDLFRAGENLAVQIMSNTAALYGYTSLDEAENAI